MPDNPWLHVRREWSGYWWFPDDPENRLPGVLNYSPEDGLVLSLVGGFSQVAIESGDPGQADVVNVDRDWTRLYGVAASRPLTLISCYPTRTFSSIFGEPDTQLVDVDSALDGIHLADLGQMAFQAGTASVENLTYWAEHSGLEAALKIEDRSYQGSKITATLPETWAVSTDTHTFKIRHVHTSPTFVYERGRAVARVASNAVLQIESVGVTTAEDLRRLAQSVADLVSLATHSAAALLWMTLQPTKAMSTNESKSEVAYYFRQTGPQPDADAPVQIKARLFSSAEIPFATVLPRWLATQERLRPAVNQILGLRKVEGLYIETQLLQAVSAAEALHGALDYDPPIAADEFLLLKKAAVDAMPASRQAWMRNLLIRNDASLKQKLLDLAERLDGAAMKTMVPDAAQWARMTVRARNELAHGGQSLKYNVNELYAITRVTTAVVLMNLLNEIGLTPDAQRAILVANKDFASAARLAAAYCLKSD